MKKNKNINWNISDVWDSESGFWLFSDEEIEDYYFESFMLKHKKKVRLFDCFLVFCFIIYVLKDLFIL